MVRALATLYTNSEREPLSLEEARTAGGIVPHTWRDMAITAVYQCAFKEKSFTVDVVWEYIEGSLNAPDPRVMGRIMLDAKKYRWITPTGTYRPSGRAKSHGNSRPMWESLIYRQPKYKLPEKARESE